MFGFGKKWKISALLIALIGLTAIFTTCKQLIGFGDALDWEPPVLSLDPYPNPLYVNKNTVIEGSCYDNVGVTEIICRDARDPNKLLPVTVTIDNQKGRWSMGFNFTEADNGNKISAEIVAYDRAKNSGESSIRSITIVVDIHAPVFEEVLVWRSYTRMTDLEPLSVLKPLADLGNDPKGEVLANVDRYQNGTFWLRASMIENETSIKQANTVLYLYDSLHDNEGEYVYSSTPDADSSAFTPQWTIREYDLVNSVNGRRWDYEGMMERGERLYFRVSLVTTDLADNMGVYIRDDYYYFCLYRKADRPKALLSDFIGRIIIPGTAIPVDIFDDDAIEYAYVDLLTEAQFRSYGGPGLEDSQRLAVIKEQLLAYDPDDPTTEPVYNWQNAFPHNETGPEAIVTNRITGTSYPESLNLQVPTGRSDSDYGDYKLIAFTRDIKLPPHDHAVPETMPDSIDYETFWDISVADNNAPLIVLDTVDVLADDYEQDKHPGYDIKDGASTGNSPEENTFPKLDAAEGRYFSIQGYSLDENSRNRGGVDVFRIAWIPYGIPNGQDANIDAVKAALVTDSNYPAGVQYWTLEDITPTDEDGPGPGYIDQTSYLIKGTTQEIAGADYVKQTFKKQFDILGGTDDINAAYRNFEYPAGSGKIENEPKLFVLYAKDLDNHNVFRTLRLLGNKNPPDLKIYDLSFKPKLETPPDPITTAWVESFVQAEEYAHPVAGAKQAGNYLAIKAYYDEEKAKPGYDEEDLAMSSFAMKPRDTELKLYAKAEEVGDIQVKELKLYDVTFGPPSPATERGCYNEATRDLTYIVPLLDVVQHVYQFRAINMLDVENPIQRTVAVTTTAFMDEIIADKPEGTYPADEKITLMAHFTNQVIVRGSGTPFLNIRYETGGTGSGQWNYRRVPLKAGSGVLPTIYLEFEWTVPEGANGRLQTITNTTSDGTAVSVDPGTMERTRPITVPAGVNILDADRMDDAFLPGYAFDVSAHNALQRSRTIVLYGIKPVVTGILIPDDTKTPFDPTIWGITNVVPDTFPNTSDTAKSFYYGLNDDYIYLVLEADKEIRNAPNPGATAKNPRIQFNVMNPQTNAVYPTNGTFYADYYGPEGSNGIRFRLNLAAVPVNRIGIISMVGLNTDQGRIVDDIGNTLNPNNLAGYFNSGYTGNPLPYIVHIDKAAPAQLIPILKTSKGTLTLSTVKNDINEQPELSFPARAGLTDEPWTTIVQYSLDNGLTWARATDVGISGEHAGWTVSESGALKILSNEWEGLKLRQVDKAGNIAESPSYPLNINGVFPELISVSTRNPNNVYVAGQTITIDLDFDGAIKTNNALPLGSRAYIIVSNTTTASTTPAMPHTIMIYADRITNPAGSTRLTFTWPLLANTYVMDEGLTITAIHLAGDVTDIFDNPAVDPESVTCSPYPGIITIKDTKRVPPKFPSDTYTRPNISARGVMVFTIPLRLTSMVPTNAENGTAYGSTNASAVLGGNRDEITLTFNMDVVKEQGSVIIKPHGNYPIPPVFPAEGYWVDIDGKKVGTAGAGSAKTYIESFYEVFNAPQLTNAQRDYLLKGDTAGDGYNKPATDLRTGQYTGPYKLMTQGLTQGAGYAASGVTNRTMIPPEGATGQTPPSTTEYYYMAGGAGTETAVSNPGWYTQGTDYMIPDTESKYVLDYQFGIYETAHTTTEQSAYYDNQGNLLATGQRPVKRTVITNIRNALNAAEYRWRKIDVSTSNVTVTGNTVVIKLDTPLLPGMQWDVTFDIGAFVNKAGVSVDPADRPNGNWWFWTSGVQTPIIRVDRKSLDHRGTVVKEFKDGVAHAKPGTPGGVTNDSFNSMAYRIESETPGATISYATLVGTIANNSGFTMAWGGTSNGVNWASFPTTVNNLVVNNTAAGGGGTRTINADPGTWLAPNVLRRSIVGSWTGGNGGYNRYGMHYYEIEDGLLVKRQGVGSIELIRTYNKDATKGGLDGLTLGNNGGANTASISGEITTVAKLTASKSYVVAQALAPFGTTGSPALTTAARTSEKGYEGVFKTLVALYQGNGGNPSGQVSYFDVTNGAKPAMILGSNQANGSPSIAGFPILMGSVDLRYLRVPAQDSGTNGLLWISTEIVSPAYFRFCSAANNSSLMSQPFTLNGDSGMNLAGGYGELSFSYRQDVVR